MRTLLSLVVLGALFGPIGIFAPDFEALSSYRRDRLDFAPQACRLLSYRYQTVLMNYLSLDTESFLRDYERLENRLA